MKKFDVEDWSVCILTALWLLAALFGNYIYNGGHFVW